MLPAMQSLCESCSHMRANVSPKGSRFLMCRLAKDNERFAKYPPQPVMRCTGYDESENQPSAKVNR